MYHYITLRWLTIHMTWLWIIIFIASFIGIAYAEWRKQWLDVKRFLYTTPLFILLAYAFGSYLYYFFDTFVVIPLSVQQILLYLSPYNYSFHATWIALWVIIAWWKFLKPLSLERSRRRINVWAYALLWSLIPLGIFLLLWDNFIWEPTQGSLFISAIRNDSNVAIYDRVLPLWIFVSLLGLAWAWIMYLWWRKAHPYRGYAAYSYMCFWLAMIMLYQVYPRRLVTLIGETQRDIKQYFYKDSFFAQSIN